MNGAARQESRLKTFIVDTFANVDTAPVWRVIVAKIAHRFWRGFRGA